MKLNEIFPSSYLKAADIGDEPMVLTIESIGMEELQDGSRKPCLFFQEQDRGLILNKTNGNSIAAVYGDDTDGWIGQRIQLIAVPVDFQGKTVEAIRVRVRQGKPAQQSNVRSGTASYGDAKGRAQPATSKSNAEMLDDDLPF